LELITELLRHIFGMGWKIAWGLILGFGISAATNLVIEIGLVIAGALAALIPRSWWETLFLSPT